MPNFLVLGAGISGLVCCHELRKHFPSASITLIESLARTGGWVQSTTCQDGCVFEQGPRTIRCGSGGNHARTAASLRLVSELGLQDRIVSMDRTHPAVRNRMLFVDGALHSLARDTLRSFLFTTVTPFTKPLIFAALRDIFTSRRLPLDQDCSVHAFVHQKFGREIADLAATALVRGVSAGDARATSMQMLLGQLYDCEQQNGSVCVALLKQKLAAFFSPLSPPPHDLLVARSVTERWALWTLRGGLGTLVTALEDSLHRSGVRVLTNTPITCIDGASVHTACGRVMAPHAVVSTLPAFSLARILAPSVCGDTLREALHSISYVHVALVHMHFTREQSVAAPQAFGYLVPAASDPQQEETSAVLGVILDSCVQQTRGQLALTVMLGGHVFDRCCPQPPHWPSHAHLETLAREHLAHSMGIVTPPVHSEVRLLSSCIPQYALGHCAKLVSVRRQLARLPLPFELAGSAYNGLSVNDCVAGAVEAATRLRDRFNYSHM